MKSKRMLAYRQVNNTLPCPPFTANVFLPISTLWEEGHTKDIHTQMQENIATQKNTRNSLGALGDERKRLVAEPKRSIARQIKILEPPFYRAHCSFVTLML